MISISKKNLKFISKLVLTPAVKPTMITNHILTKYHSCNCTKNTLDNFYYYLNRELNSVKTSKDIWSNCIFPFVAIFLSVTMTFIFSIVGSINTYNNAINSIYDLEYMQQYGETYKSILNAFDQNLTSAMRFYAVGAFFL